MTDRKEDFAALGLSGKPISFETAIDLLCRDVSALKPGKEKTEIALISSAQGFNVPAAVMVRLEGIEDVSADENDSFRSMRRSHATCCLTFAENEITNSRLSELDS